MSSSNQDIADQAELSGWVIEKRRSHYTIGYWVALVLGMMGQMVPPAPRITYTLRNSASGERRAVTLPGDHSPADLAATVRSGPAQPDAASTSR